MTSIDDDMPTSDTDWEKSTKKFPTAQQMAQGPCIQPCSLVLELAEAGLRDHELLIEHKWWAPDDEEPDEDGDITLWPAWEYAIRRVGTDEWHLIGLSEEGFNFTRCEGAGAPLMKYFSDLEELLGDEVADLTYDEEEYEEDDD